MAKIWFMRDGRDPSDGQPIAERSIVTCKEQLGIRRGDFLCGRSQPLRFGDAPTSTTSDYRHVVVEIDQSEGVAAGWKAGYYLAHCAPKQAYKILGLE